MRHLAQVNIAKMVAPLDDPVMAGFVGQLEVVNAIADGSPGFVWRLQDDGGDATSVRVFDDDAILVNMSVWESTAALHGYVYRSGHGPALRDRAKWFVRMPEAHLAMWWIDAGEKPTVEQAVERLLFLRAHGETPFAFTFRRAFEAPSPDALRLLDGRTLRAERRSQEGDCTRDTLFTYAVDGEAVRATYRGGGIRSGQLLGVPRDGLLEARYEHVTDEGHTRAGECVSAVEPLPDGHLRLHEAWWWTGSAPRPRHYSALVDVAA
jgi:uncharacterized protein DUF3291